VIAAASGNDSVLVSDGLDGDGLVRWIVAHARHGALVVLDVPIDGCGGLSRAVPRRPIDDGLARIGIPLLPSYKSGDLGPRLRDRLRRARPDLEIVESYPYSVLRVLWGRGELPGSSAALTAGSYARSAGRWSTWWTWPPRYKRARRTAERREALARVAGLLRACGPRYARLVRSPSAGTAPPLARLSDEYDAILGLVAADAAREGSPWSWSVERPGCEGRILTIAPSWLREAFALRVPRATPGPPNARGRRPPPSRSGSRAGRK
jgi:hypothetical protein